MINKESAYKKISELVERFEEQYESYKKSDYKYPYSETHI